MNVITETNELKNEQPSDSIRINMAVEDLIGLSGAVPVVIGRYRGCSIINTSRKLDSVTGKCYESSWVIHYIEVQADRVFDQLRITESLTVSNPDYLTPYKMDSFYIFPISKFAMEKGLKDCRMLSGKPAIELKGELCR